MADLEQAFNRMKGSWMIGGSAVKHAPIEWQEVIGGDDGPEAELRLIALVGQAAQLAFEPVPSHDLTEVVNVPMLAQPALPGTARTRFRRLFAAAKSDRRRQIAILAFIAARGYVAHPADWMPSPGDEDVPDVYLPWIAWQLARDGGREADSNMDSLDGDNWDYFTQAERLVELAKMRRTSPAAARELIIAKAASLSADQRHRLINLLAVKLSGDDAGLLETLLSDRSGKVKTLAAALLARLGHGADPGELESELADFLKVRKKGILSGKLKVSANKLKTDAQRRRLSELFGLVSLSGLCRMLGVGEEELVNAWSYGDNLATEGLVGTVAATGSDELLAMFADQLVENDAKVFLYLIADRLDDAKRTELAVKMLRQGSVDLDHIADCAGDHLGHLPASDLTSVAKELAGSIVQFSSEEESAARTRRENAAGDDLFHLGLLADDEAASAIATRMVDAGVMSIDPKLDMLRFNETLPPREEPAK